MHASSAIIHVPTSHKVHFKGGDQCEYVPLLALSHLELTRLLLEQLPSYSCFKISLIPVALTYAKLEINSILRDIDMIWKV